ncbi:MAG: ATPase, T2SS/T4P/T4SS family [Gemmatimonadaceae bacterium]|nr:ATPase, T2SS/T4P/T4SS family [Gemmatimonadaceae bacterium]
MFDSQTRSHWLRAIVASKLAGAGTEPVIAATTSIADAWQAAARYAGITQEQLAVRVGAHFHIPVANFALAQRHAIDLVPEKLARAHHAFALRETDQKLVVAIDDPTNLEAEQLLSFASGRSAGFEVATPEAIQEALDERYEPDRSVARLLDRVGAEIADAVRVVHEDEPEMVADHDAKSPPIVKLTTVILGDAVRARASDIHLEPAADGGRVRFRVDGVMQPYTRLPMGILNRVISSLKIMGRMNIADRRRPQDGRARIVVDDRPIDLRLSTVPTRDAEKAVVRLLDPGNAKTLEGLSLTANELAPLRGLIGRRDGIVLVTGPTGSGKTTLLYAALREMPTNDINIMTVEDPIEYDLAGLTQMQVETKAGVTFATALRSILRQDPDVIFIGEIRDAETAAIAVQASLTGHLVLASLHANDAVGTVGRLADLGVERGDIANTLRGATAQRLIRRVCPRCVVPVSGDKTESESRLAVRYGVEPTVRAVGCAHCAHTGYFGRVPLLEVLVTNTVLETLILAKAPSSRLQAAAVAAGMRPLRDAAVARVRSGETTLEEIDRELGETDAVEPAPSGAMPGAGGGPVTGATVGGPGDAATSAPNVKPLVLVADDDAVTRAVARSVLVGNGYRVSEAVDGQDAIDQLEKLPDVALMVLDLAMPRMTGMDVLRRLRASIATATLPVIVLTGATDNQSEVDLMDAGADDYVRKPLAPERFVARVKAALRRLNT